MMRKALMLMLVLATIISLILAGCNKAPNLTAQDLGRQETYRTDEKQNLGNTDSGVPNNTIVNRSKPFISPIAFLAFLIPLIQSVITLVLSILGIYTMILAIKLLKKHIKKDS